jgi:hypothetical protein
MDAVTKVCSGSMLEEQPGSNAFIKYLVQQGLYEAAAY